MKKAITISCWAIGIILITTICLLYKSNNELKSHLGLTYSSNIANMNMHLNRIDSYLKSTYKVTPEDYSYYDYEINSLNLIRLPGVDFSGHIEMLKRSFSLMTRMNKDKSSADIIKIEKQKISKLLVTLLDATEKMQKVGYIPIKGGNTMDYKIYYNLESNNNVVIKKINADLKISLQEYIDYRYGK